GDAAEIHELEIRLVHQPRGAEGVPLGLTSELVVGDPPQVVVDQRDESVEGPRPSLGQVHEGAGDVQIVSRGHRASGGYVRTLALRYWQHSGCQTRPRS